MDRGAWRATVCRVAKVGRDLVHMWHCCYINQFNWSGFQQQQQKDKACQKTKNKQTNTKASGEAKTSQKPYSQMAQILELSDKHF